MNVLAVGPLLPKVGGSTNSLLEDVAGMPGVTKVMHAADVEPADLERADVLLIVQSPYPSHYSLVDLAIARGVKVGLIPDIAWFPNYESSDHWLAKVDFIVPTSQAVRKTLLEFAEESTRRCGEPKWAKQVEGLEPGKCRWGVDLGKFKFAERPICNRLLLVNGGGGIHYAKGAAVLGPAAAIAQQARCQVSGYKSPELKFPPNVEFTMIGADQRVEQYRDGDVLLAPYVYTGFGLQVLEAQACGLPTVAPDAPLFKELGPVRKIPVRQSSMNLCGRNLKTYTMDVRHLAACLEDLTGKNVSKGSLAGRNWVEKNANLKDVLNDVADLIEAACVGKRAKVAA